MTVPHPELAACVEAGAAARVANVDHGANPHLAGVRPRNSEADQAAAIKRCEAWWDGWEEVNKSKSLEREPSGHRFM